MSNSLKYLLLALLVAVLALLGLGAMSIITLPGPLSAVNGLIRGGEEEVAPADPNAGTPTPLVTTPECPEAGGAGTADPAIGAPATPGADSAVTDPLAPGGTTPANAGAPAGASRGVTPSGAAGERIVAAAAPADPLAGTPDPAAGADPAVPGATGDPAAGATATPDPCLDAGTTDPFGTPGTGTPGTGTPGTGTAPGVGGTNPNTGGAPGTGADPGRATTDGTNSGNTADALRLAADIAGVLAKAKIQSQVTATLLPATGGVVPPAKAVGYRKGVTAAILVVKLNDPTSLDQWTKAPKPTRVKLVQSFFGRMAKQYPKAARSISVVDPSGTVLAVGDAPQGAAGTVKVL